MKKRGHWECNRRWAVDGDLKDIGRRRSKPKTDKEFVVGERKEFFVADKDIWELFKQITKERKKREIEPVLKVLEELQQVDDVTEEGEEFKKVLSDLLTKSTQLSFSVDFIEVQTYIALKSVVGQLYELRLRWITDSRENCLFRGQNLSSSLQC